MFKQTVVNVTCLLVCVATLLTACDSGSTDEPITEAGSQSGSIQLPVNTGAANEPEAVARWAPALDSRWQWQLQGTINTSYNVDVYDIDLFDTPAQTFQLLQAQGKHVICYFSAGTFENWRTDASLFPTEAIGTPLPDYPSERWLDVRSELVRQVIRHRFDLAKQIGCDAVEPDNIDGYTYDSGFPLTAADQLDFIRWLGLSAHEAGLAIGLKNNVELIEQLVDTFDFAVNEQCFQYDECEAYAPFIDAGKPVFHVEYSTMPVGDLQRFVGLCLESKRIGMASLIMPILLDDSFRIDCVDVLASN